MMSKQEILKQLNTHQCGNNTLSYHELHTKYAIIIEINCEKCHAKIKYKHVGGELIEVIENAIKYWNQYSAKLH